MQIESWAKIYQEEAINLQKICMRYLHDEETAQDIVQDTFVKAIENEESIKHGDKRKSWLRKVVVNETFQRLKKLNKIPIMNIEQVDELQSEEEEEEILTHERKIIEKANLSKQDILQTLNSIVISQKTVFTLFVIEGCSHKEIAELLSVNETASRALLARARKNIQKLLVAKAMNKIEKDKKNKRRVLFAFPFMFHKQKDLHFIDQLVKENWEDVTIADNSLNEGWRNIVDRLPKNKQEKFLSQNMHSLLTGLKIFTASVVVCGINGDATYISKNENLGLVSLPSVCAKKKSDVKVHYKINSSIENNKSPNKQSSQTNSTITKTTSKQQSKDSDNNNELLAIHNQSSENICQGKHIFLTPQIQNPNLFVNRDIHRNAPIEVLMKSPFKRLAIENKEPDFKQISSLTTATSDSSHPENEIKFSLGVFPFIDDIYRNFDVFSKASWEGFMKSYYRKGSSKDFTGTSSYYRSMQIGSFSFSYTNLSFKRHGFGGSVSLSTSIVNIYKDSEFKKLDTSLVVHYYGILTHYQYNYVKREMLRMYCGLHLGYQFHLNKYMKSSKNNHQFTAQVTLLGLSVGKRCIANLELGFGNLGIARFSIGCRF